MAVPGKRVQKINTTPLSLFYKFFQARVRVEIWLFENTDVKIQGTIIGFDEYMNLTIDNACEINTKKNTTKELGRILFKGDNVALVRNVDDVKV